MEYLFTYKEMRYKSPSASASFHMAVHAHQPFMTLQYNICFVLLFCWCKTILPTRYIHKLDDSPIIYFAIFSNLVIAVLEHFGIWIMACAHTYKKNHLEN